MEIKVNIINKSDDGLETTVKLNYMYNSVVKYNTSEIITSLKNAIVILIRNMKDKYQGYWKEKGSNKLYQIVANNILPRWRDVILYRKIYFPHRNISKYEGIHTTETVDYLRLHCERISESEFKKYIK